MNATEPTPSPGSDNTPVEPGAPDHAPAASTAPAKQARNPLHGVTLEAMVVGLADYFGWDDLGRQIPIRCFQIDPSVGSSLKFLRKTPWAREKVESLYLFMLRDQKRNAQD
ncbi:MAG: VF530 family DNA-binding protein [Acidovorax sp.]|uniref:VF530 family protein n=1 Tax=Acidovorax sp. TaxID=1872122 RepID=UPI00391A2E83